MAQPLPQLLAHYQQRTEQALLRYLPDPSNDVGQLYQAMHYSSLNGGKRLRAVLIYLTANLSQSDNTDMDIAAAAMEMVHAYSLIHDDLPAMDNDDLRRGKPTCHRAFSEATAILAGDALHNRAFSLLCSDQFLIQKPLLRLQIARTLIDASGDNGMIAGQMLDMAAEQKQLTLEQLQRLHRLKTGALIEAAIRIGYLLGDSLTTTEQRQLDIYGAAIGLAFQIWDDILDVEGDTTILGKRQGADIAANKSTYPAILGLGRAKELAQQQIATAVTALDVFPQTADPLRSLAHYIVERIH